MSSIEHELRRDLDETVEGKRRSDAKLHRARMDMLHIIRLLGDGNRRPTDRMANALVMLESAIEKIDG